jgi:hypothetical protein
MVNQEEHLDVVFRALSNSVRRRTIVALEPGSHSVSQLSRCTVTCGLTETPLTKASR